jgi:uncharacterized protein YndB with AHSA1/START domain
MDKKDPITVEVLVEADAKKAWEAFVRPESVREWNFASPDWHCPSASSDLRAGGSFTYRMEARDGSFGFDFYGTFEEVAEGSALRYALGDGRKVSVRFEAADGKTRVTETFDPETENSRELQERGWAAILENYRAYAEGATIP